MNYELYQIGMDTNRDFYINLRFNRENTRIERKNYAMTYSGVVEPVSDSVTTTGILESLFEKFNVSHPRDFKSYSMSVGDVVKLGEEIFLVAPVGWEKISAEEWGE